MVASFAQRPLDLHFYRISIWRPLALWCLCGLATLAFSFVAIFVFPRLSIVAACLFAAGACLFAALLYYFIWDYRKSSLEISLQGVLYRELGIELKATWPEISDMRVDQWREGFITTAGMEGPGPERFKLRLIGASLPTSSWDAREIQLIGEQRFIPLGLFSDHLRRGDLRGLIVGFAPHLKGALDRIDAPGAGFSIKTMYIMVSVSLVLVPAVTVIPALFHVSRTPVERNPPKKKDDVKHPDEKGDAASLLKQVTALIDQGDALRAQGQFAPALKAYRESLAIAKDLARWQPDNANRQRAPLLIYASVGDVLREQKKLAEALDAYRECFAIAKRLARQHPESANAQSDISVGGSRIGDVLCAQQQFADALKFYRDSVAIDEQLAKEHPESDSRQYGLAIGHERIGEVAYMQKQWQEAADAYGREVEIARPKGTLAAAEAPWVHVLSYSSEHRWRALCNAPKGTVDIDRAGAVADLRSALKALKELEQTGRLAPPEAQFLPSIEELLSAEDAHAKGT